MNIIKIIIFLYFYIGMFSQCFAEEDWKNSIRYNGFITQGFIKTTDNSFFGDSTDGSFEFTEIGANASVKPSTQWLLSGQVLMRNAGDMYDADPAIDFALADYTLLNTSDTLMSMSFGRYKNPVGFYNDTRDVAFTRSSTFLPQVIYFDQVRNAFLSSDGLLFNLNLNNDLGNFKFQFGIGEMLEDDNVELVYLANDWDGELEKTQENKIGRLIFESHDQRLRLALSAMSFELNFNAGVTDPISSGVVDVQYYVVSFEFNADDWKLIMEYGQEPVEYRGFGVFIPDDKKTLEGYYVQAGYQLRPDTSIHIRYERGYLDSEDKYGEEAENATGIPGFHRYAISWSAGLCWNINKSWLMMLEYQKVEGTFYLSPADNPVRTDLEKNWDMINILVSHRF